MIKRREKNYFSGLILLLAIMLISIYSYAVMDRPAIEPMIENPGGSPAGVHDCILYQGWDECWATYRWAQGAKNPQQCWSCVSHCYFNEGSNKRFPTIFCKRRCATYGSCSF